MGGEPVKRVVPAGHSPSDPTTCTGWAKAWTARCPRFPPPLWRMGQYAIGRNGVIRRMSVSYADELRPMDDESVIEKYKALQAVLQESAT